MTLYNKHLVNTDELSCHFQQAHYCHFFTCPALVFDSNREWNSEKTGREWNYLNYTTYNSMGTICDSFREVKQMFLLLLQNAKWFTFSCLCYSVIQPLHRSFVLMRFLDIWQVGGDVELDERNCVCVCVLGEGPCFLITRYVLYGWLKSQLHRGERV